MCALRAHIKLSVFGNIFSGIEKAVITFSILEKMFLKTESLMCTLRAHINRTLNKNIHPSLILGIEAYTPPQIKIKCKPKQFCCT